MRQGWRDLLLLIWALNSVTFLWIVYTEAVAR